MATMRIGVSPAPTFAQRGFTLTELAVVLVIVALLIGGMIVPLSTQQDIRNSSDTQKLLAEVTEALIGYAASHSAADGKPNLPCPAAIGGSGIESARVAGVCPIQYGELPWATLSVGRQDAWNNALRYQVTSDFSKGDTGFSLSKEGDMTVCTDSTSCPATTIATKLPAVYFSLGKNGPTGASPDEAENTDGDTNLVSRTQGSGTTYDDVVSWLSPNILFNRMIAAGRLP